MYRKPNSVGACPRADKADSVFIPLSRERLAMKKRLYKSNDKKICGVCGGIAEYFDTDPTVVRFIWGILTILSFGMGGILAYILCAFIFPDKSKAHISDGAEYDTTHTSEKD